jgi:membrane protein YfhO
VTRTLSLSEERATRRFTHSERSAPMDLVSLGVLALCALTLHRDGLNGGPAFYELDTRLFYFPLADWVSQQLHSGNFPLWLPGIFTGYPIFADGELGLAYLPQLALLSVLPASIAMVWLRVLHVFLAGAFTYGYLRTLRLDPLPALGGGLVFAFGSFLSAQMHHENVIRSAVWLPAALLCLERSVFSVPRSTFVWSALGGLAFAQAALGLHVQPVLMSALALGLYALFRALLPSRNAPEATRTAYWPLASGAAIVVGGLAIAAVQWLPLAEWALVSSRRGGVDYVFASAFALPQASLLSAIFPFFYRLSDATTWWSLWQQWEIELYVGIPTLALGIVGIVLSRRLELAYFVPLGVLAVWIGMAEYAPLFNLHHVLWSVPGFSFLRAPARFTYLVVLCCACLAAFGLQVLNQRRLRLVVALLGGVPAVGTLAALLAILPTWRNWLIADPARAAAWVESAYLSARAQYPIDPQLAVSGFVTSLDPLNVKTAWSLALLALTALGFVAWLALGPSRARIGQSLFVGLMAVDLLVFAYDFHPLQPLASLTPDLQLPEQQRVLLHDSPELPQFEPNQLLAEGIATTNGYSSLPSQRHVELEAATSDDPRLFDLWSAPFILEPADPPDAHTVDGVAFRAQHPLASGFGGSTPQTLVPPASVASISAIRIIGTLSYAYNVPQGQTVATLGIGGQNLPIRAGVELSERAFDRPSLKSLLAHQRARVALDFDEATPEGEDYIAHLYEADLPLAAAAPAGPITFTPTNPSVQVEIYGLGLVGADGRVTPLELANRDGLSRVSGGLLRNARALPRAYVLPRAQAFSPARHPDLVATQLVASPDVDLHTMVLIENDQDTAAEPAGAVQALAATRVDDLGPNAVRVVASADGPSYLVLSDFYHRGWTARVDGQPARVLIANALFRAVAIDQGTHVVDFQFQPLSLLIGAVISALSVLLALGVIVVGVRWRVR